MRALALLVLVLGCSSSPLAREADDNNANEPESIPAESVPEARECSESLSLSCKVSYETCLAKDANGCANLSMCIKRCSVASCAQDCGGFWAISPEARDYYACLASGFEACFAKD